MKKVNFHTIENVTVSQELQEKLLAIPQTEQKKPLGFRFGSRVIAAAASIAVVTAVSVSLILSMGNNSELEIKPSDVKPTVPYSDYSEYPGDIKATDATGSPSQQPQTATVSPTAATEDKADTARQIITGIFGQSTQSETSTPTTPFGTSNTSATQRSTQPTAAPTQQGTVSPTQAPTIPPTQSPTQQPTQAPTAEPTAKPSEAPTHAPTAAPISPTLAPGETISPEERRQQHTYNVVITRKETKPITGNIYCMVCDSEGNILGDQDIFSDEHLVEREPDYQNGKTIYYRVSYCPEDHGVNMEPGRYWYYFYTDDYYETGKKLFSSAGLYYQ